MPSLPSSLELLLLVDVTVRLDPEPTDALAWGPDADGRLGPGANLAAGTDVCDGLRRNSVVPETTPDLATFGAGSVFAEPADALPSGAFSLTEALELAMVREAPPPAAVRLAKPLEACVRGERVRRAAASPSPGDSAKEHRDRLVGVSGGSSMTAPGATRCRMAGIAVPALVPLKSSPSCLGRDGVVARRWGVASRLACSRACGSCKRCLRCFSCSWRRLARSASLSRGAS